MTANHQSDTARSAGLSLLVVVATGLLLLPLANWQLGQVGLVVVALATLTIVAAVALSGLMEQYFVATERPMYGFLAASAARLSLPLIFVVALVWYEQPGMPAWSALYVVPLYFAMLVAETYSALRRTSSGGSASRGSASRAAAKPSKSAAKRG